MEMAGTDFWGYKNLISERWVEGYWSKLKSYSPILQFTTFKIQWFALSCMSSESCLIFVFSVILFIHLWEDAHQIQFFKAGSGQCLREIFSIEERFNLYPGLVLTTKGSLGFLNFTSQFLHSSVVFTHILALLLLVQLDEMFHDLLIEIFTTLNVSKTALSVGSMVTSLTREFVIQ